MISTFWWVFLIISIVLATIMAWLIYRLSQIKKTHLQLNQLPDDHLFQENNLLHILIDNMPDYIYIKDKESRFIRSNQKIANVHGLKSPRQMEGKTDYDFYPRELAEKFYRDERDIVATGKPLIGHEEVALNEKREKVFLSTTKIPIKDKKGKIIGIVGMGRDITALKKAEDQIIEHAKELEHTNLLLKEKQEEIQHQAEELAAQTESLINANQELEKLSIVTRETDNVVIILDAEGNFEYVNNGFTKVYGYTLEQFIQTKGKNILQTSFNPFIKNIMAKCRDTKETVRYQSEAINKDEKTIWTQSTLTPILDIKKNIIKFVAVDSDISALKKAQEMINQQKKEIENQRDKLEKLNITKDKFFSIIAHDLRNPFHSIQGFSDLLVKDYAKIEDQKKLEYIRLIFESSQHAYYLLENLLQWSRSQSDTIKFNPSEFPLSHIIDENLQIFHVSMERKNITFTSEIDENTIMYADKNMTDTVIRNLLNNAIKYTPDSGSIFITCKDEDKFIAVSITDTGIGINPEDLPKLFYLEEFHTTQGTEGEAGTGLGLIICKDFIQRNGGEISVVSKPGKGTTFTFTLPKSQAM